MRIQELERRTGLERPTIRFYEKEGLLQPNRAENGYRDYTEENVQLLLKIKLLRQLGMSLEKISQIQKGSTNFTYELEQQVKILTYRIQVNTRARAVCETMQRDRVDFTTLDAARYLTLLEDFNYGKTLFRKDFQENVPKPIHPWRRYFARALDYTLFGLFVELVLFVILRIRPLPGQFLRIVLSMAQCAAFIPLEALMLHYFGTTPGKMAMGIRIEYIQGGNLPMWAAMERSFSVWKSGIAFGIPIIELIALRIHYCHLTGRAIWRGQKYNEIDPPMDMDWDTECELQYTDWEGKRITAFVCILVLCIGLTAIGTADGMKPRYRGDELTVEQFAANYNSTIQLLRENVSYSDKLQSDGSWFPASDNTVVIHVGGEPQYEQPQLVYETENGILRSITYQNSWTEVFYMKPVNATCENIALTVLMAQNGVGIPEMTEFSRLLEQSLAESEGTLRYQNLEIRWEVQCKDCTFFAGIVTDYDSEENKKQDGTVSVEFQVIIYDA